MRFAPMDCRALHPFFTRSLIRCDFAEPQKYVGPMSDPLTRARRLRSRAQECKRLAESSHSAEMAKHYHLISKHYLSLAHLEEEQINAPTEYKESSLAPE